MLDKVKAEHYERDLLEGLARNEHRSTEAIYKENYGIVQTFITQNNGSYDDARDVFQEAMMVLYENSKKPGLLIVLDK